MRSHPALTSTDATALVDSSPVAPTTFVLRHLEPDQIRRWYSTVLSDDRPTQRKHAYALLGSILREAEEEGLIERNPCQIRNAGRVRRTRDIEPASPAELNRLMDLPRRQGLPVLLAGWCGLRAGEVRGLRRRDLDLAEGVCMSGRRSHGPRARSTWVRPRPPPGSAMSASRHTFSPTWPST